MTSAISVPSPSAGGNADLAASLAAPASRRQLLRGFGAALAAVAAAGTLAPAAGARRGGNQGGGRNSGRNGRGTDDGRRTNTSGRNDRDRRKDGATRTPGTPPATPAPAPAPAPGPGSGGGGGGGVSLPAIQVALDPCAGGVIRVCGDRFPADAAVFLHVRGDWNAERGWDIDFTDAVMALPDGSFCYEVGGFYPFHVEVTATTDAGQVASGACDYDPTPIPVG